MKIAIIGAAGNVGSAAAFNIAVNRVARELVMIDPFSPDRLEQYAYDLCSAMTGVDTLVHEGGYEDMTDCDIIINAAGSAKVTVSRQEVLPQNLPIIRELAGKIRKGSPGAVVIMASNPVCPLNYAMYHCTGFERGRVIGFSANDSLRFRMFLADELGVPSSAVEGTVIGEHGDSQVPLFSSVRVNGKSVQDISRIKETVRQSINNVPVVLNEQREKTGRTAAWTTSMGLTQICRAIKDDTGEMIPCSVALHGEYGYKHIGISVPCIVGRGGVQKVLEWDLEPEEREALERSVNAIKPSMEFTEEFLGVHGC